MEETILSTSFPIFYVNSLEDYFGVMRDCLSVGYNYPTPLANFIPKEMTEQRKMDDIGDNFKSSVEVVSLQLARGVGVPDQAPFSYKN